VFSGTRAQPVTGPAGSLTDHRFQLTTINLQPAGGHIASAAVTAAAGAVTAAPTAGGASFAVSVSHTRLVLHRALAARDTPRVVPLLASHR
jgi:L-serine deaminase